MLPVDKRVSQRPTTIQLRGGCRGESEEGSHERRGVKVAAPLAIAQQDGIGEQHHDPLSGRSAKASWSEHRRDRVGQLHRQYDSPRQIRTKNA